MKMFEYEVLKQKGKQLECDKCKCTWSLEDTDIHSETVRNEKGQEMLVHFFLCPECHEIYIVGIVDMKVRMYLEKVKRLNKKIERLRKHHLPCQLEADKRDHVKSSLLLYEKTLENKYNKFFYLRIEEATASLKRRK